MRTTREIDAPPPLLFTPFEKDRREGEAPLTPLPLTRLQAGDEILRINGQNIESWRRSQVSEAMEGSIDTLQLVVKQEAKNHGMGGQGNDPVLIDIQIDNKQQQQHSSPSRMPGSVSAHIRASLSEVKFREIQPLLWPTIWPFCPNSSLVAGSPSLLLFSPKAPPVRIENDSQIRLLRYVSSPSRSRVKDSLVMRTSGQRTGSLC
jgi:membrane-associated protease RseP (regulator of RpoE activity)